MKKYLAFCLASIALNCVYADVIELDNKNAQKCINQLTEAKNNMPIILEYLDYCPAYHDFLPIYEKSASDHSKYTFYKVNDVGITDEVKDKCLGQGSSYRFISPKVTVNLISPASDKYLYGIIPIRSDIGSLKAPFSADDLDYLLRDLDSFSKSKQNYTIYNNTTKSGASSSLKFWH